MRASRPLEVVYFTLIRVPIQTGESYIFFAVDEYSKYVFSLGATSKLDDDIFIDHIKKLFKDKAFSKNIKGDFTLIISIGEHIEKQVTELLAPLNGKVIFDFQQVEDNAMPYIEKAIPAIKHHL